MPKVPKLPKMPKIKKDLATKYKKISIKHLRMGVERNN
jgi:hypothetical protein